MKVLQVNSFHYHRGGDCTHMFATADLLASHGHQVAFFSMQHPLNLPSPYAATWPSYIDFKEALAKRTLGSALGVISRTIYSGEARRCMARLLDAERPDLVHLHNIFHHLTPSILTEVRRRRIPVVWTLHDYTIVCPNNSFHSDGDGTICEACKSGRFYMAPVKRCKKGSRAASFVAMLENYSYRLLGVDRRDVRFISPSEFLKRKFEEHRFRAAIEVLPNFVDLAKVPAASGHQGYAVYIGRVTRGKGIGTLVKAFPARPDLQLKIVGDGDLLRPLAATAGRNIEFLGLRPKAEVQALVADARFAIVPSEWYENLPYSVLEPMAQGKPVIASRIGGIPELVSDGVTGLLFTPGNAQELGEKIAWLADREDEVRRLGANARRRVEERFSAETHYQGLLRIYRSAAGRPDLN